MVNFYDLVFQKFPLSLGIQNKTFVNVKGLNKIFCFSNIILVWKQRTVEFSETVTMDAIFDFEIETKT